MLMEDGLGLETNQILIKDVPSSLPMNPTIVSSGPFQASANETILVDTTLGSVTILTPVSPTQDMLFSVKKATNDDNFVTIVADFGDRIETPFAFAVADQEADMYGRGAIAQWQYHTALPGGPIWLCVLTAKNPAHLDVAKFTGTVTGTGSVSFATSFTTGIITASGTQISVSRRGYYSFSYDAVYSTLDIDTSILCMDRMFSVDSTTLFKRAGSEFAKDEETAIVSFDDAALSPGAPPKFTVESQGFHGSQVDGVVELTDNIELVFTTDRAHKISAEVSVILYQEVPD